MIEIHWIWILAATMACGSLGFLTMGMLLAARMKELILANRKLQRQRDDALENEEICEETMDEYKEDARKYRELMEVKQ